MHEGHMHACENPDVVNSRERHVARYIGVEIFLEEFKQFGTRGAKLIVLPTVAWPDRILVQNTG
jgi:hypothetical protein